MGESKARFLCLDPEWVTATAGSYQTTNKSWKQIWKVCIQIWVKALGDQLESHFFLFGFYYFSLATSSSLLSTISDLKENVSFFFHLALILKAFTQEIRDTSSNLPGQTQDFDSCRAIYWTSKCSGPAGSHTNNVLPHSVLVLAQLVHN